MRWRLLPHDLPPWQTVEHDWRSWRIEGRWEPILAVLRERERQGRGPTPSAAILDRGREGGRRRRRRCRAWRLGPRRAARDPARPGQLGRRPGLRPRGVPGRPPWPPGHPALLGPAGERPTGRWPNPRSEVPASPDLPGGCVPGAVAAVGEASLPQPPLRSARGSAVRATRSVADLAMARACPIARHEPHPRLQTPSRPARPWAGSLAEAAVPRVRPVHARLGRGWAS